MERFILPPLRRALTAIGAPEGIPIRLKKPRHVEQGDLATAVAVELAPHLHRSPIAIAQHTVEVLELDPRYVSSVEVAPSGFINIRLTPAAFQMLLAESDLTGKRFGRRQSTVEVRAIIRCCTHVAESLNDARTIAIAEAVASLLSYAGYETRQEHGCRHGTIEIDFEDRSTGTLRRGNLLQPGGVRLQGGTALLSELSSPLLRFHLLMHPPAAPLSFHIDQLFGTTRANPYRQVQYAAARIAAIERHVEREGIPMPNDAALDTLTSSEELSLIRAIVSLPSAMERATEASSPDIVCDYLQTLSAAIHSLLDVAHVTAAPPDKRDARLRLLRGARESLTVAVGIIDVATVTRL